MFKKSDGQVNIYRIIYYTLNGFIEIRAEINKIDNQVYITTKFGLLKAIDEYVIDVLADPSGPSLLNRISLNYPQLKEVNPIMTFFKKSKGTSLYRVVFLTAEQGLIEIQIMILPEVRLNEIEYLEIRLVKTDPIFISGFNYFVTRYLNVLSGASAEKIGSVIKEGAIYNVIIFKSSTGYYLALYTTRSDGSMEF